MKWIKLTLVLFGLYMAQSYYFVSDSYMQNFLEDYNTLRIQNPTLACNYYSDNFIVDINNRSPKGNISVSGGKKQACEYLQSGETVLGTAKVSGSERLVNIEVSSSFPWQSATANFSGLSARNIDNLGTIHSQTHQVVEIRRGLLGPKMIAVTSTGGTEF